MSKEILFLAYFFPPHCITPSLRALEITKRLQQIGYKLFVVSAKNYKNIPIDTYLLKDIDSKLVKNTRINHIAIPFSVLEDYLKKISPRLDFFNPSFFLFWIPFNFIKICSIIRTNNIKLIYATGPPFFSLYLGYLLKKVFKIPLIIEYRDPWSYNPYERYQTSDLFKKKYIKLEKKIINSADIIIAISEGLKQFLIKHFPDELNKKKIFTLPSGLNIDESSQNKTPEISRNVNNIILTFTGTLYGQRDLKMLIQIISEVEKLGKLDCISLIINIFGKYDVLYLKNLMKEYNVEKYFNLGGFISHNECFTQIKQSTFSLHIGENFNYPTISFKVWEYLSMGKKIVYLGREDSYTAKYLKNNKFGFVIPLNNLKLGVKRFIELIEGFQTSKIDLDINPELITDLTWDKRVSELVKIFEEIK